MRAHPAETGFELSAEACTNDDGFKTNRVEILGRFVVDREGCGLGGDAR